MRKTHGAIVINTHAQQGAKYQAERMSYELTQLGSHVTVITNNSYMCRTVGGNTTSSMKKYDYCVFLDKDKYLLASLELDNIPTFNNYYGITTCDDKMLTYIALSQRCIDMPTTLAAPLCYTADATIDISQLHAIENTLSYPLVVKQSYGSLGKQVYLANNRQQLLDILTTLQHKPHMIQQYIDTSAGKDIRVIVVGGKVLGCMLRQSNGDFRSNVAQGGQTSTYPLTSEIERIATTVSNQLQLDYCGLDLLIDNNKLLLCEVNSNAFFEAFEHTTGINVAQAYAKHILASINK